ncbi:hypothetical protein SteCoe_16252 [Stentor coeruleus]|uniref:Uncharacterized protein n=1 Tax=Stentor coeruleus TaxID=5963 RepID=A0A1R2C1R7_9CILI|nr:hypothetical protein SteCoe_16252 [Stentor coeruleus]
MTGEEIKSSPTCRFTLKSSQKSQKPVKSHASSSVVSHLPGKKSNLNHSKSWKSSGLSPSSSSEVYPRSLARHTKKSSTYTKGCLPLPRGETAYALAKNAEYREKNLDIAEYFYHQAIKNGDRVESAIKDLASLLHQRGRTQQACDILDQYRHYFKNDEEKFENLYKTLAKQLNSKGNSLNKSIKISGLSSTDTDKFVLSLFFNTSRVQTVELHKEHTGENYNFYSILRFNSHSSARKTLEGFHKWDKYRVEWLSLTGEVAGDAHYARHKMEEYRKYHPTFDYTLFERDPQGYIFCLPVDGKEFGLRKTSVDYDFSVEELIGKGLYSMIFRDFTVECH